MLRVCCSACDAAAAHKAAQPVMLQQLTRLISTRAGYQHQSYVVSLPISAAESAVSLEGYVALLPVAGLHACIAVVHSRS